MPMILTFLAASSIGFASAANCAGAMTIAAGFDARACCEHADLAAYVDSDCAPSSTNVDAEIFTGLACAS